MRQRQMLRRAMRRAARVTMRVMLMPLLFPSQMLPATLMRADAIYAICFFDA